MNAFNEKVKKKLKAYLDIKRQEARSNHSLARFFQLCSDPIKAATSLAIPEFSFYSVSGTGIHPFNPTLKGAPYGIAFWSAQRLS